MNLTINLTKKEYEQFKLDLAIYCSNTSFLGKQNITEIKTIQIFAQTFNINCNE